jgi:hypothetical protein
MIDRLDPRLAALVDDTDDSDWSEVVSRARELAVPSRRRVVLALAAALAIAAVASPALGLRGQVVRLFSDANHAPKRVQRHFARVEREIGGGVNAKRAIKVLDARVAPQTTWTVWLAPTRQGGYCASVGGKNGRGTFYCTGPDGYDRLSVGVGLYGRVAPDGEILSGPVVLDGGTSNPKADSLVLRFEDGKSVSIPLVWVTAPVNAGFFVYSVPETHWRIGHLPTTLTMLSADGDKLDEREIHGITVRGSFP